jgi:uncharacterized membrane protein
MGKDRKNPGFFHIRRYLVSGVATVIPLLVTWIVFEFLFRQLTKFGMPSVRILSRSLKDDTPVLSQLLLHPWFQNILAALIVLLALYLLGWTVNRVIGKRIINFFESVFHRLPVVSGIYKSVKQLISVLQQEPGEAQRVVLIEFPNPNMKTVGFLTRILDDKDSGGKLAAVYVPTTPNPTSGYLEIIPLENVVSTDWTVEEAMNFIISGGAVGANSIGYGPPRANKDSRPPTDSGGEK